jgi:hypothetical protein
MASVGNISLSLSISWKNQDEFERLLKEFENAKNAYYEALDALNNFHPDIKVVSNKKKGRFIEYEQED